MGGGVVNEHVLLTGATGNLGPWIARALLRWPDVRIVALVRAADRDEAQRRLVRAWWDWPELVAEIGRRIEPVPGDVREPDLGLDADDRANVVGRTTRIIHAAADLRLDASLEDARRVNVGGTKRVLGLARCMPNLSRCGFVSTTYVCGTRRGEISEGDPPATGGFANVYERTKAEAEILARGAMDELPVSIFRPGMIVGDSETGRISTFNTVYPLLRRYLTGDMPVVPVRRGARLNLVPVDMVADAVARLVFDPRAEGKTFHLTASPGDLPAVGQVLDVARDVARKELDVRLRPARFAPVPSPVLRTIARKGGERNALLRLLPYANEPRTFLHDNTDALVGPLEPDWSGILPRMVAHASRRGFMHRSGQTVHEQILFRMRSRSRPVTFADLIEGRLITRPVEEVHDQALRAASALASLGVRKGDRVAIVGLNSTRYLALDIAIGMTGAVSVPLYYTSPPAEIDTILHASRARMLLVGAPAILARLDELGSKVPIVSFWREPVPSGVRRDVMPWEAFLARCEVIPVTTPAPVDYGDLATIRYTSGTTGTPKGVVFTHGQLAWMGETMASLLPWRTRTRPVRYLSFLPLNHVVEGILAAYGGYYLPASISVTYLEEFRSLREALPLVRPTVFFSVPRVFEKLWEAFEESPFGRAYHRLRPGPVRSALRPLARFGLLRKAGLDRCDQLIAGSAQVEESLQQAFHEMGVELHSAYGLTEAPLVTMCRAGHNRIGTAGMPLPDTSIRIVDGEFLVRGPQVTSGYFEPGLASPIAAGWLATGDLGRMTDDGCLVIEGRKKEMIATSYGKKVMPAKVEALLRNLPGIAEAMLVGEGRPYCVAVLWAADEPVDDAALAAGIEAVNERLSHPEQVRRWNVLPNDLSIERGDLTANLKLRRGAVQERLATTIASLYTNEPALRAAVEPAAVPAPGGAV
jgi:long-chain acyl-CoA synthetase